MMKSKDVIIGKKYIMKFTKKGIEDYDNNVGDVTIPEEMVEDSGIVTVERKYQNLFDQKEENKLFVVVAKSSKWYCPLRFLFPIKVTNEELYDE